MATMLPPVYGVAFEFDVVLFAQSDNQIKTTPTIAAGDFVISKANGATANLTTTPSESPASSGIVRVQLSATEMEADKLTVKWHDASGAEWHDGAAVVFTAGQTFNTMDANIDSILADTGTDGVKIAADAIADVADAVWDEAMADHLDPDSTGGFQNDIHDMANAVWQVDISGGADEGSGAEYLQNILTDTAEIGVAGAGLTALASQASVNDIPTNAELTSALADLPTNAELAAAIAAGDDPVLAAIAALNNLSSAGAQAAAEAALAAYDAATGADISGLNDLSAAEVNAEVVDVLRTDTIPDSYAADGAQPTIAQAVLMLLQFLSERDVSGTTITVKKPDGATAMTFTLDDANNPTSITRAS